MPTERDLHRLEYLLARAKSASNTDRVKELVAEIRSVKMELGQEPGEDNPPPSKMKKEPKPLKKGVDEPKPCPCGCGQIPDGIGIFMPGHDGRICGFIRKMEKGITRPREYNGEVAKIYQAWIEAGKPGTEHHPKIKKVVEQIRRGG